MSKELKTGIVAILIIAIFMWGYNFLKGTNLLDPNTRQFQVEYSNIAGLSEASLVTINGLRVGKVNQIEFNKENGKRGHLVVSFTMDNDFQFSKNSVVKIYSPSPLGGSNLAVIPDYEGEMAVSGDILKGEIESSLFTSIGEKLDPLQTKLERVIVSADSLFKNINNVLDLKTQQSLKSSVKTLEYTLLDIKKTVHSASGLLDSTAIDLQETVRNTKYITENLSQVSDTLAHSNIGGIMRKAEITLNSVNTILEGIDKGKGSLGKFVNDDAMYDNLTNVSKELEELLREMKLNPKRFVHFSLFGKRAKSYDAKKSQENTTNN